MKKKTACLLFLWGLFPGVLAAGDTGLQGRIDDVNVQIEKEQEVNQKLKDDIAARDREIAELKQKLKELEQEAAAGKSN